MQVTPRQTLIDSVYITMAVEQSRLSYCSRLKVGSLLVSSAGDLIANGYNGTVTGDSNLCEIETEYGLVTRPDVIHSEVNTLLKVSKLDALGATLYISHSPCASCASIIAQMKIRRVVYHHAYRILDGITWLRERGVIVDRISLDGQRITDDDTQPNPVCVSGCC